MIPNADQPLIRPVVANLMDAEEASRKARKLISPYSADAKLKNAMALIETAKGKLEAAHADLFNAWVKLQKETPSE